MMEQNENVVETKQPKNKFWKWTKRIFLFLFALFFLLFGSGIVIGYFYQDEVKGFIIQEMNKQLITPIVVNPEDIHFSVIKNFPHAAIEFNKVSAANALTKNTKDTLFHIGALSLQFNIWDVFDKNYTVKKITIDDAFFNIQYNAKGEDNFHFWKTAENSDTTSSNFKFRLEAVYLTNVLFKYTDVGLNYHHNILIKKGNANGAFDEKKYTLKLNLNTLVNQLTYDNTTYVSSRNIKVESDLAVTDNNRFDFLNTTINLEKLRFALSGNFINENKNTAVDLQVKGQEINVADLLTLLPNNFKTNIDNYKGSGVLQFTANIKGATQTGIHTNASFSLANASLTQQQSDIVVSNINLNGSFSDINNGRLLINNFSANLDQSSFKGRLELNNFKAPELITTINATADLDKLQQFLQIDTLETLNGKAIADIYFKGRLPQGKDKESTTVAYLKQATLSGNLELSDMRLKLKGSPFIVDSVNGSFLFDNSNVFIEKLKGTIAESDFRLKGALRNILPYLFSNEEELFINAKLKSNKVDVAKLLSGNTVNTSDTPYELKLSERVHAEISCAIKELSFNKFVAKNITADAFLESKILLLSPLQFSTMDGDVKGEMKLDGTTENEIELLLSADINKINVNKLFNDLENFGQQTLTNKNIKGYLTSKIKLKSIWSKYLKADLNQLHMLADVKLEKGELNNYEPLKALSKFINVAELENIKFATLENQIEIKNQLISIPRMEIKNSVLNVICNGTHSFKNDIDYHMRLRLTDYLAKKATKAKKENEEFGEVEDDGNSRSIPLLITGTVDDPIVKYDVKGLKQKIKEDIQKEKENIKTILREEFGWFKKDSLKNAKKKEAENTKFKIKWDEDGKANPEKEEEDF